jgi:hypothetical protein
LISIGVEKVWGGHVQKALEDAGLTVSNSKEYFTSDVIKAFGEAFKAAPMIGCAKNKNEISEVTTHAIVSSMRISRKAGVPMYEVASERR